MSPTHEQIIAEAWLRHNKVNDAIDSAEDYKPLEHFVIEVVCEGWKPPEPVDPDLLAFRWWFANRLTFIGDRERAMAGHYDKCSNAQAYLAGYRVATERERERAKVLVEYIRDHWPKGGSPVLAKYQEGLK